MNWVRRTYDTFSPEVRKCITQMASLNIAFGRSAKNAPIGPASALRYEEDIIALDTELVEAIKEGVSQADALVAQRLRDRNAWRLEMYLGC